MQIFHICLISEQISESKHQIIDNMQQFSIGTQQQTKNSGGLIDYKNYKSTVESLLKDGIGRQYIVDNHQGWG